VSIGLDLGAAFGARLGQVQDAVEEIRSEQRQDRAMGLEVVAGLVWNLGRLCDQIEEAERRRETEQPIWADLVGQGTCGSTGILALSCGGPPQGTLWHVKVLAVGGPAFFEQVAGFAEYYSSGWIADAASGATVAPSGMADLRDAACAMPNVSDYEDGQFLVRDTAKCWVVVRGGTPGQQYVVGGCAKQVPDLPRQTVEATG